MNFRCVTVFQLSNIPEIAAGSKCRMKMNVKLLHVMLIVLCFGELLDQMNAQGVLKVNFSGIV